MESGADQLMHSSRVDALLEVRSAELVAQQDKCVRQKGRIQLLVIENERLVIKVERLAAGARADCEMCMEDLDAWGPQRCWHPSFKGVALANDQGAVAVAVALTTGGGHLAYSGPPNTQQRFKNQKHARVRAVLQVGAVVATAQEESEAMSKWVFELWRNEERFNLERRQTDKHTTVRLKELEGLVGKGTLLAAADTFGGGTLRSSQSWRAGQHWCHG